VSDHAQRQPDIKPWDRRREESAVAYRAFLIYRDLGAERTFVAAAQGLGKSASLLRRWAARHDWKERIWAWEVALAREAEEALRRQREQSLRRQAKDADQLQRLAMARFSGLIHRDDRTGELTLDPGVTPRDAVAIYKFGVELEDRITQAAQSEPVEDVSDRELRRMSTEQLYTLLALAKERSEQKGDDSDDDTKDNSICSSNGENHEDHHDEDDASDGQV
jgi:hypothetical protein